MNKLKNSAMRTVPSHLSMKPQVDTLKPTLDLTPSRFPKFSKAMLQSQNLVYTTID